MFSDSFVHHSAVALFDVETRRLIDVGRYSMKKYLPFVPAVFGKVLAIVLTLVLIGFVVSYLYYGELTGVDIAGSLISALIFSYMVHLWLLPPEEF